MLFIGANGLELFRLFSDGNAVANFVAGAGTFGIAVAKGSATIEQWVGASIVLTTCCVVLYPMLCLVQFFRKASGVPHLMIGFYVLVVTVQAINLALVYFLPDTAGEMGGLQENIKGFARSAVAAVVWIPYFITSERVGNTFVR